CVSAYYAMDYW
nr:immunoglobulin heavy chain junction region [Mus musculus]NSM03798.1 immunoglobulin heavy chain junction region [Mus musculus]NSM04552.1 immunoglobulin heavy chain junction region [Mus musculus]NSM05482.1 immunoglobulin heavy chain junction region [Mus musculus]NSM05602.1 immunoglobulin heavy chain junction region [Mus musculus]